MSRQRQWHGNARLAIERHMRAYLHACNPNAAQQSVRIVRQALAVCASEAWDHVNSTVGDRTGSKAGEWKKPTAHAYAEASSLHATDFPLMQQITSQICIRLQLTLPD